jgi:OOP family OmpA-OmpF porin
MEIGGHTDAQGSEEGNRALSQARAEAVLVALQGRRVDVSGLVAKGYGEANPIADNETEEGREANRRIEFTLIGASKPAAAPSSPSLPTVRYANKPDPATEAAEGPDFTADTSPSVAPKEKTIRPERRPEAND